ncbi:MAG: PTS sugar transporter subunit IIA [Victivallales bacterium]|nr:PTS sugar transporter subunit IIA [Victivallales bacterium]
MNKIINQLLQIQDLTLILRENDILHKRRDIEARATESLKRNISEMKEYLSGDILSDLQLLSSKYDIFVVPMINDTCTGCFMKMPVGIANNVRQTSQCISCPSCRRFLYEGYQSRRPSGNFQQYKGIARFSSVDLMLPDLSADNHADALREIALLTAEKGFVENGEEFAEALLEREALASTAVGSKLAFPHARGISACGMTLALGISGKGIDFGEGETVHLVFASAVPTQTSVFYIDMVSKIARYFGKAENTSKMIQCKTAEDMWRIFVKIGK